MSNETKESSWTPDLMMKIKGVGAVRVSPDGKRVVYTVTEAVMTDEKSEYLTQIHLANADGSQSFQLTFSDKSSNNPQWSPDGKFIAFTSKRSEKVNLYRLRLDGGEAEQLTDAKADIGVFAWSPDGTQIAYTMPDPKPEEEEKRDKGKDDWRWIEEEPKMNRLYVIPVEKSKTLSEVEGDSDGKREPRLLTAGNRNVLTDWGRAFDWSPDGKSIAFSHSKSPKADDWPSADVSVVDLQSGDIRQVAATSAAEMQPCYSPDGRWLALTVGDDPPRWAFSRSIQLIPTDGGAPRTFSDTYDGQPALIGWSQDGRRIHFTEAHGTMTQLQSIDIETGAIEEVIGPNAVAYEFQINSTGTMVGFTSQGSDRPIEAFVSRLVEIRPVQVSKANADVPPLPLGKTESIQWKSRDGLAIEGLMTYPVGYESGKRVPLLLVIHGGPAGVFVQNFIASSQLYPVAAFASRGYAVLRPNPRGSSGYGQKFRFANMRDWGGGDFQDLMSGVDYLIEKGIADPDRLGVMGWSYGGFMTSWVITQTHRFKAASVGAGVTNLMSFTGTSDIPGFVPDYFGAQPWDDLEPYKAHSAMFNMKGVKTPTLIQHPESDIRVPISQGYELFNALKAQGVPTRMLVLPRQPHGPNEPKMQLKVMETNIEWFEEHIMSTRVRG